MDGRICIARVARSLEIGASNEITTVVKLVRQCADVGWPDLELREQRFNYVFKHFWYQTPRPWFSAQPAPGVGNIAARLPSC